jgi:hypothetical protein
VPIRGLSVFTVLIRVIVGDSLKQKIDTLSDTVTDNFRETGTYVFTKLNGVSGSILLVAWPDRLCLFVLVLLSIDARLKANGLVLGNVG